ncbi:MAG: efflux RND transporter periplasmic adaptor subunit, partial [Mucilaginibacter sp.]
GMYVTALISTGSRLTAAVPNDAIVRSEGRQYIFVATADSKDGKVKFKKTMVTTGVSELGYTGIRPIVALPPGVQIAAKGAFYLESKAEGGAAGE